MRSTRAAAGVASTAAKVAASRSRVAAKSRGMVMPRSRARPVPSGAGVQRTAEAAKPARMNWRLDCRVAFQIAVVERPRGPHENLLQPALLRVGRVDPVELAQQSRPFEVG